MGKLQENGKIERFFGRVEKSIQSYADRDEFIQTYNFEIIHFDENDQFPNCNKSPYEISIGFPQWEGKEDLEIIYN
jgi:hypothetical protein